MHLKHQQTIFIVVFYACTFVRAEFENENVTSEVQSTTLTDEQVWQDLLSYREKNTTKQERVIEPEDDYVTLDDLFVNEEVDGWNSTTDALQQDAAFVFSPREFDRHRVWDSLINARSSESNETQTSYSELESVTPTLESLSHIFEDYVTDSYDQEEQADEVPVRGSSLVFIFDSTGSMHDELNQMKEGAAKIFEALRVHPDIPIHNYILIPFEDPRIGPVTITTDDQVFRNKVEEISVAGGGDCPEMSLTAIKRALEICLPRSYLYVFTDATSKDHALESEVLSLIQRREAHVDFILTGDCGDTDKISYQVYKHIAEASSGQVYNLNKREVKEILKYVKVALQTDVVNLLSQTKPAPPEDRPDEHKVVIDETLSEFTVSVSGKNASIRVTNPKGHVVEGPPQLESLLTLKNVKIVNVKEPDPGPWKILINSESDYTLRSTGLSGVHFNHGFSTVETNSLMETNHRPLKGAMCYILIQTLDFDRIHNLTSVDVVGLNGETIQQIPLEAVPGKHGVFKGGGFMPPANFFHLGITGFGNDGYPIRRITATAISSQLPEKPMLTMKQKTVGRLNKPGVIKCHVQSVVPFTVQWYKDGYKFGEQQNYAQTCEVILEIKTLALHSQGNYSCRASNIAGVGVRSTFLAVTGDPPSVKVNSRLTATLGESVYLDCEVHSDLPYHVEWTQFTAKNEQTGIVHKVSKGFQLKNNTLHIDSVTLSDEGWYMCLAKNKGGKGEGRLYLIVTDPLKVVITPATLNFEEGGSARLSCTATGRPTPEVEWRKDSLTILNKDPTITVERAGGKVHLVIGYLEKNNAGVYTCHASNSEESVTATAELIYMEKPSATAKENNLVIKVGNDAILTCTSTGVPQPTIKWFRGLEEILPSVRIVPNEGTLKISPVTPGDAGEYSCTAFNSVGNDTDYIGLLVGTPPTFLQKPRNKKIQIHHNSTIACSAVGVPPVEIKWTRVGSDLPANRMFSLAGGALRITNMQLNDTGQYTCTAQNIFGVISSKVLVEVTGVEKPIVDDSFDLTDVRGMAGDIITIPCGVVLGNPPGIISWYKNGAHLINSSYPHLHNKIALDANGNLILRDVTGAERGDYLCTATNVAGNSSRPYKLIISESPKILNGTKPDLKAIQGGEIVIPCPIEGDPKPLVTWMKNGVPILSTPTVFQKDDGSLIIRNLTVHNTGTYVCTAVNSVGSASKATAVHIQVPPVIEEEVAEDGLNIVEGHVVVLNCRVTAIPSPIITWYKNNESLALEDESEVNPEVLRFIAKVEDSGIYKCVIINDVGSTFREFNVTILVPPNILERNEEVSIKATAGAPITLHCKVRGFPRPTILWQRNGLYLTQNSTDLTILDNGLLIIQNVTKESSGTYICDAENLAGITQRIYYLQVNFPPRIVEEINVTLPIKIKEGEEYSLPCLVEGNPKPTVVWRKNGFPIFESAADLLILEDNTLVFLHITTDMTGQYRCEASNAEGSVYKDYDIEVYAPPAMITDDFPTKLEVNEGDSITLTCPTTASVPPPNIQWIRNGKPLNDLLKERSDEAQMKLSEDQRALTIPEAHPGDNGNYSCVATNIAGRTDANFLVDVLMTPHFEEFNHLAYRTTLVGGQVALNCSVSGNPQPKVSWRKGNSPITPQSNPGVTITVDKQHLMIANSRVHHSGTYICTAANKVNIKEREFYISVIEGPSISGPTEEAVDVMIGTKLLLSCEVKGVPEPEIIWLKGTTKLNITSRDLSIENVNCSVDGIYTCQVTNPAGTKIKTFNVTVLEPPIIEEQDIIEQVDVLVGENLSLKCKTKGQPAPEITWLHNGHIIDEGSRTKRQIAVEIPGSPLSEDGYAFLVRPNVTENHRGTYTVLASNRAGVTEKNYNVKILVPPQAKGDQFASQTMTVLEHLPVVMKCPVDANPKPAIHWYLNDSRLNENTTGFEIQDENLLIKQSKLEYSGNYSCIAENSAGNLSQHFLLTVIQPPFIIDNEKESKTFLMYENMTLECNARGYPQPEVSWFKSTLPLSNDTRLTINDNGHVLSVWNVTLEDSGWYICVAANDGGAAEKNIQVEIHEPPILSDQSVVAPLHKKVQLQRGFSLHCAFDGHPLPKISWYKDGGLINETERRFTLANGAYLTSLKATADDIGEYKCIAENIAGTQQLTFQVDVIASAMWTEWSPWSECQASCAAGHQTRVRTCEVGQPIDERVEVDKSKCEGENIQKRECFKECEVHGGWGEWTSWTSCSETCDKGTRRRYRSCNSPEPRNGGKTCEGEDIEEEVCLLSPCPIHGQWSAWTDWSTCTDPCGGTKHRWRKCDNPEPSYGGRECEGRATETVVCKCSGHAKWLPWSEWSPCSATCGKGHRKRYRVCRPSRRGKPCKGENLQIEKCLVRTCPRTRTPTAANLHVTGHLNGKPINNHIHASIANLDGERLVSADMTDVLEANKDWFPYSPFLLSPVSWNSAYEVEDADNGFSLTNGRFFSQSDIEFVTGEGLRVKHEGQGLDDDGNLWVEIEVAGEVPIVQPHASVTIRTMDQDFVQTGENSLYSTMQNDEGEKLPFAWNSSIHYDHHQGTMPYLVETLSMRDVHNNLTPEMKNSSYTVSSTIKRKFEDNNQCPLGFIHDPKHSHCSDIDECEFRPCGEHEMCINTFGSYRCDCGHGFESSDTMECNDIDECLQEPALCSHFCHNTRGSFRCSCPEGSYLADDLTCEEHRYEDDNNDQSFESTVQSYRPLQQPAALSRLVWPRQVGLGHGRQLCMPGFYAHKYECIDYDECADDSTLCDEDEICLNIPGSYQCLSTPCPVGFDRLYPSKNCMRYCDGDVTRCSKQPLISETVTYHAVSLKSLTPFQDILQLDVVGESGTRVTRTRFRIIESGELFRVRVTHHRGSLYALRELRQDTLYRVRVEALSYGEGEKLLYSTEFIIFISLTK